MNCEQAETLLAAYVFGEVQPPALDELAEHLKQCGTCSAKVRDIKAAVGLLEEALVAAEQPTLTEKHRAKLDRLKWPKSRDWSWLRRKHRIFPRLPHLPRPTVRFGKYFLPAAACLLVAVVLAAMFMPALGRARQEACKAKSKTNLRTIGAATALWKATHGGDKYPPSLKSLAEDGTIDEPKAFLDPSRGTTPAEDGGFTSDYDSILDKTSGKLKDSMAKPSLPLAWEKDRPGRSGRNVAFFDGRVEHVTEKRFQQLMKDAKAVTDRLARSTPAALEEPTDTAGARIDKSRSMTGETRGGEAGQTRSNWGAVLARNRETPPPKSTSGRGPAQQYSVSSIYGKDGTRGDRGELDAGISSPATASLERSADMPPQPTAAPQTAGGVVRRPLTRQKGLDDNGRAAEKAEVETDKGEEAGTITPEAEIARAATDSKKAYFSRLDQSLVDPGVVRRGLQKQKGGDADWRAAEKSEAHEEGRTSIVAAQPERGPVTEDYRRGGDETPRKRERYLRQGKGAAGRLYEQEDREKWAEKEKEETAATLEDTDRPVLLAPAAEPATKRADELERATADQALDRAEKLTRKPPTIRFNPFVLASEDNLSTFGLETDTGSYTLTRSYIRRGYLPPEHLVRVEEFVNAFDYNYPGNVPGAFSVDVTCAPSPFRPKLYQLKVGVKARRAGRDGRRPNNVLLCFDTSSSMGRPERLALAQKSANMLVNRLHPSDAVTIVIYGTNARLVLDATSVKDNRAKINRVINALQSSGSTNLAQGLALAYQQAQKSFRSGRNNLIVLISDGIANVGPDDAKDILRNVKNDRRQGITLTCVGVGSGRYNDEMMEQLADNGDGRYVFIDTEAEARRVFVDEIAALQVVAKDAKIQVEFDPKVVRRYRVLGYESRDIADEDFRNAAVDAGEIGSGQSATALYELELLKTTGRIGTVRVRYHDAETGHIEEIASPIETPDIVKAVAETPPRFRLAACAAQFAEILRDSPYVRHGTLKEIEPTLAQVCVELPLDDRAADLLQMVRAAQGARRVE